MAYRVVQQSFWNDEKVVDKYSPEDKYFFLYLLTNPQTRQLGIYKLPIKLAAFQLGYSVETVKTLLERFEKTLNQIKYNYDTQEIAIGNYLLHSIIKGGKPVIDCVEKDLISIKDKSLINFVCDTISEKEMKNDTIGKVYEILKEKRTKKENINDNDNDNDNDINGQRYGMRIVDRIVTEDNSLVPSTEGTHPPTNDIENFIAAYNGVCTNLPKCIKPNDKRKKAINKLLKEFSNEEIKIILEKTQASDFLTGKKSDWKASFDWIINPTNALKVLEGNYDNNQNANQINKPQTKMDRYKEIYQEYEEEERRENEQKRINGEYDITGNFLPY